MGNTERQVLAEGYLASADGADYGKPRLEPAGEHKWEKRNVSSPCLHPSAFGSVLVQVATRVGVW